jgi:hypothetical protein
MYEHATPSFNVAWQGHAYNTDKPNCEIQPILWEVTLVQKLENKTPSRLHCNIPKLGECESISQKTVSQLIWGVVL